MHSSVMILFFVILSIVFLIAVGLVIYAQHLREKKRTKDFEQVAQELGFEFAPKGDAPFLDSLKKFQLFSQGHSKKLWNLMRGKTHDLDVAIFDYKYITGGGKHSHTWLHSVVCFRFEGGELPSFALRPENVWHKIGSWFGYQDIDFASHPDFSSKYLLRGQDETAIRELFSDDMLRFYAEQPARNTEGAGNLLVYYRSSRVDPANIHTFMEEGFNVFSLYRPVS